MSLHRILQYQGSKRPVRRIAEVRYKAALSLQLTGQLPEALRHSEVGIVHCGTRTWNRI